MTHALAALLVAALLGLLSAAEPTPNIKTDNARVTSARREEAHQVHLAHQARRQLAKKKHPKTDDDGTLIDWRTDEAHLAHQSRRRLRRLKEKAPPTVKPIDPDNCTDRTYYSFVIFPDAWPHETSWKLLDSNSNSMQSKAVAENGTGCLDDGMYTFTIFDTWGDGLVETDGIVPWFKLNVAQARSTASSGGVDQDGMIKAPAYEVLDSSTYTYQGPCTPSPCPGPCPGPPGSRACSLQIRFAVGGDFGTLPTAQTDAIVTPWWLTCWAAGS
ncbi:hypothetical protein T492DRAFT_1142719 [Pavlovales sp. CCMP2436]|nr:hypothetical protein T492DRAFT_1142719 [Pavlovales sp. CCMP2436]